MSIMLRAAAGTDIEAVARIERASFADAWSENDFTAVLDSAHTIFLVAEDAQAGVAGYVILLAVLDDSEILNIAVSPDSRGRSIGSALLDAAISRAIEAGAREMFLEVREANAAARALYESRGFAEVSRRVAYYRNPVEDALVLRRALQ
jgi:ribosomal-protein-alanine acetyltransferase